MTLRCPARPLLLFLLIIAVVNQLYSQTQTYLGDGPGWLIRKDTAAYSIVRAVGNDFERIVVDKTTKDILSIHDLGAKTFGLFAANNGDYIKFDTITDLATGLSDFFLQRLNANGDLLWENHFGDNSAGLGYFTRGLAELSSGEFAVIGHSFNYPVQERVSKFVLVSADGQQVLSERTFSGEFSKIEALGNQGFYVSGSIRDTIESQYEDKLIKLDAFGDIEWEYTPPQLPPNFSSSVEIRAIKTATDGGLFVSESRTAHNSLVVKLDGGGQIQWSYGVPYWGTSYGTNYILPNADGGCTLAFYRVTGGGGHSVTDLRTYLMRLDNTGNLLWERLFEGKCEVPGGPGGTVLNQSYLGIAQIIHTNANGYAAVGYGGDGQVCDQTLLIETDGNASVATAEPLWGNKGSLRCMPNPAMDKTLLQFQAEKASWGQLELFDPMGRKLYSKEVFVVEGDNAVTLLLDYLKPGLYGVRIGGLNKALVIICSKI